MNSISFGRKYSTENKISTVVICESGHRLLNTSAHIINVRSQCACTHGLSRSLTPDDTTQGEAADSYFLHGPMNGANKECS